MDKKVYNGQLRIKKSGGGGGEGNEEEEEGNDDDEEEDEEDGEGEQIQDGGILDFSLFSIVHYRLHCPLVLSGLDNQEYK